MQKDADRLLELPILRLHTASALMSVSICKLDPVASLLSESLITRDVGFF